MRGKKLALTTMSYILDLTSMNQLAVVLTYRNVYGEEKGLDDAIRLISNYPVEDAVTNISRIGVGVVSTRNIRGINPIENQIQLLGKFVSRKKGYRIVKAFQEWAAQDKTDERGEATIRNFETQRGFFSSVQIIMAAKLALCNCESKTEEALLDKIYDDLTDAFLMINDRIGPEWDDVPNIAHMLAMSQQFQILEEPNNYFYRWKLLAQKILVISEREEFKVLGLKEKFKESFKMELGSYSQFGRFFFGLWELLPMEFVDRGQFLFPVDLLKRITRLTDDEIERIIQEYCEPPKFYKREITLEEQRNPWDNKKLLQKPIVRIGNKLICVDRNLIALKAGEGLYYGLINLYDDETEEGHTHRNMVSSILGYAFQEYLDETLDRIFLTKEVKETRQRFIRGDDIPRDEEGKRMVDGIIDYGAALVIIEFKSSLLSLRAKKTCKKDGNKAWVDWLERTIFSGADQIDKVIEQIKNGELDESLNINHNEIQAYYPLIITLQPLPNASPDFLSSIEKELLNREIFTDRLHIRKLELMHISNLEDAEILIDLGVEFKKLLYTKIREAHYNDWNSFYEREYPDVDFSGKNTEFGRRRKLIMQQEMDKIFDREEINKIRREEEDKEQKRTNNNTPN